MNRTGKDNWFESFPCKSGVHCATCRALDKDGAAFRRDAKQKWAGIELETFPCPHGKPWGPQPDGDRDGSGEPPCCH